ncbi:chemotaxis-specific protein-glutamate methyltransferase CheB [Sphingomonas sp. CARO-RG-8B-R24-01]|uniref:chemotaxis-specific protein-glutamate methyltransferase CheB n=1 Tax=Sphingomonas sp. CARO-RG-8B-R24-01 TaxID=2914831 RepID=UPI001F585F75|nr:chemotaxis-specific protein-glutamate methyltransferase CheB [Sphingomonas sp. CARO-RG-8B-R24-01]
MSEGDPSPSVLIVDDSVVARAMIARAIEQGGRFGVAGAVPHAAAALAFLRERRVDVIVLDIEMPGVSGLVALPDLIAAGRGAKVLVVSSIASDGAAATIEALAQGAADTLVKPDIGDFAGRFSGALVEKLDRLLAAEDQLADHPATTTPDATPTSAGKGFDVVAIGASTGGIHALSQVLREVPASFPVPILVTQHLPASFMPYFAAQLATIAGRPCDVASDHLRIRPGRIIVAPGDAHMRVARTPDGGAIRLSTESVKNGCMPSVDPMFDSVAEVYGNRALGIVLSGMGRDGSEGACTIVARGGSIVVQDRASSVVWGMPGAIAKSGHAAAVLTPVEIGKLIAKRRRPA